MPIRNTTTRWGSISQALHWVIVALIVSQFVIISIAESLPLGGEKIALIARHKSIGITILMLAVVRLVWRWLNPASPLLPNTLKPYERTIANVSHTTLYVLMFAMPLTGWTMSSARNFPVSWFTLFQLPDLVGPNRRLYDILHDTHETLAWVLVAVAALHVLGALKHHFILKDDVLRRMLPFTRTTRGAAE
jgi:cytochrome b561